MACCGDRRFSVLSSPAYAETMRRFQAPSYSPKPSAEIPIVPVKIGSACRYCGTMIEPRIKKDIFGNWASSSWCPKCMLEF